MVTNAQLHCNTLKVVSLRSGVKKTFFFQNLNGKKRLKFAERQTRLMSLIGFSKKLFEYSGISIKEHTMKRTLP